MTCGNGIAQWTRARGVSPRLYPGALVWAVKKPGRELRNKVEQWLAWKRVAGEISAGIRGFVIDKAGKLLVTNKRILLIHKGTTSISLTRIVDLEVDEDRQLLTLTRDGLVTPSYLTTPDALRAGAIIAALAEC